NHLISEEARHLGIEISNKQLQEKIAALPQLQRDGQFDYDTYEQILRGNGMTPAQFESRMRADLARQMVQQMVEQGVAVSEDEARAAYNLRNQTIALRYIEVPYSNYLAKNSPTDQQLADYYKQHQDDFREPERAQVELIHYTPKTLAGSVNPSDQEIKDYYQA